MKRIFLFLAINLAMMLTLGVLASVLGVGRYVAGGQLNLGALLGFAMVFGMGGSFLSLLISKPIAKWSVGAKVVDGTEGPAERFLVDTVSEQARQLGIKTPEVAIFPDPSMNAFATGATRNSAMVAFSTGLLTQMGRRETEAVIAHEMSHVSNGDMVTMALLQGVLNVFVIFAARALAWVIDLAIKRDNESGPSWAYGLISFGLELVFGLLASIVVAAYSRQREYRADAGGVRLAGRDAMASALGTLRASEERALPSAVAAFGIRSGGGLLAMLSSHPSLDDRIARIMAA